MDITLENPIYTLPKNALYPVFEATFKFGDHLMLATFSPEPKPTMLANGIATIVGKTLEDFNFLQTLPKISINGKEYGAATNDPEIFRWLRQYVIDLKAGRIKPGPVELRELSAEEIAAFDASLRDFR